MNKVSMVNKEKEMRMKRKGTSGKRSSRINENKRETVESLKYQVEE